MDSLSFNIYQAAESGDNDSKVKEINKLLSSAQLKKKGLQLMLNFVYECNKPVFLENCINWMQWCCKNDNCKDISLLSLKVLSLLIQESVKYGELNKPVSHFLSTRFFGKHLKSFVQLEIGWICTEMSFMHYRGPCGTHAELIEQYLAIEVQKGIISSTIAHIYSLLPSVGEGGLNGINYKNKWKSQFEKFLNISQSILHDFFLDFVEFQGSDHNVYEDYRNSEHFSNEQLFTLFYNYCYILEHMLLCKFPVSKTVIPEKVFGVICRCLNITFKALDNHITDQSIKAKALLPQFHIVVCSLLNALIVTCKTHLLPYSQLILKLIKQNLQLTCESVSDPIKMSFINLRISTYDILRNWLLVAKSSAYSDSLCKVFVSCVMDDIFPKDNVIILKDVKNAGGFTDKAKDPIKACVTHNKLCYSALRALELYLKEVGCIVKPEHLKVMQPRVVKQIIEIQNCYSTLEFLAPYSSSKCRYELYRVLQALAECSSPSWPPPIQWALRLFLKGVNDCSTEVSFYCSMALSNLLNIVHPEFSPVSFKNLIEEE